MSEESTKSACPHFLILKYNSQRSMNEETKQLLSKELLEVQDRLPNETKELIDYAKMVDV